MKIGLVCPYNMFQFAGGVQDVVVNLQKFLNNNGHTALIITPRPRLHFDEPPKDMILVGRSAKMSTPFATMVDLGFKGDTFELEEILENEQFDILHFHEPWIPFLSRQILTRSRAVHVGTFHATMPDTVVSKSFAKTVLPYSKSVIKYIDHFTAVSDSAAEYIGSLTKKPISIVPNGIYLEDFTNYSKENSAKKTIVYVGRLEKRKGVEYLLYAYARLREWHDDVRLIIAGKGVRKSTLEQYVEEYEIPDVEFAGFVSEDEKKKLMASADVFCSPAPYGESFGIVLLESMALNTPVVAGNNPGYAGVMTGHGRLSLVNPLSTEDFAQRLEMMIYDETIRDLWLKWAAIEVKKYKFDDIAKMYEAEYFSAMKTHVKQ